MSKRPLAIICIFFIIGILLTRVLPYVVNFSWIFIITLLFILSSLIFSKSQKISNTFLLLSVTSFAALLYINSNTFPDNHISHFLGEEKHRTDIVGVIKSPALTRRSYYGKINSTYLFEIEAIKAGGSRPEAEGEWLEIEGLAHIRIQTEKDYGYGDRILVRGTIKRPAGYVIASEAKQSQKKKIASSSAKGGLAMTKKDFNYREYLERQNIFALINTKEHNVTILSRDYRSNPILRCIYSIREKLKNQILEKMPLESGAFLRAILLGDRSELPKHIQESFKNSGTMHILAISGLHVGLIAVVILGLFRFIRITRALSYIFTILFLIFFALLTLCRPSVVRAVVMACVFLLGMLLGRQVDVYNSLGMAALFILIRNPKDLFSVGFQLSFLAVLSICLLTPWFKNAIDRFSNFYIRRFLFMPFAVSLAAWLGTFPLIMYYFRIVTPVAILANLFILPLLFVLISGGLIFLLLCWVPFVGPVLAGVNNFCISLIFSLTDFFASLRCGHFYI